MEKYVKACLTILKIAKPSKWDYDYVNNWYESGVEIETIQQAYETAIRNHAQHPVRYTDAVIRSIKQAKSKPKGSFDTDEFFEAACRRK